MPYKDVNPPPGAKISIGAGKLDVPENPIIPFIRGDGTGADSNVPVKVAGQQ